MLQKVVANLDRCFKKIIIVTIKNLKEVKQREISSATNTYYVGGYLFVYAFSRNVNPM